MDRYDALSEGASSRLTSPASRSPTPPSELLRLYPTPPSSEQCSMESSPAPDHVLPKRSLEEDADGKPAKRRKLGQPKPRTTHHLDLQSEGLERSQKEQLDRLMKVLYKKRKIVVVAGAGISVSAGIPDFRSSTGLFRTLKGEHKLRSSGKALFDASVYKDDKSTTQFHDMVRNLSKLTKSATATPFHHLLATLAGDGRLLRLYSQNVDGIDTGLPPLATQVPLPRKAPWPKTIQLHGGLEKMVCSKCHELSNFQPELFDGPTPPACSNCVEADEVRTTHAGKRSHGVGRLRPRMVLYNEHNPDDEAIGSVVKADLKTRPDALIVVGTTLKVPGVKRIVREMCKVVRDRRDGTTIWVNNDPPPPGPGFEWDLIVKGPCDHVASLASMPKWDEKVEGEAVAAEDEQKIKSEPHDFDIVITTPSKPKTFETIQGVVTPVASPRFSPVTVEEKQPQLLPSAPTPLPTPSKASRPHAKVIKVSLTKPVKTIKPKATAAKKAGPKSKKAGVGNAKISDAFSVSKASVQVAPPAGKDKPPTFPGLLQFQIMDPALQTSNPHVQQPMQPVSPGAVRNNASPPFHDPQAKRDDVDILINPIMKQLAIPTKTPDSNEAADARKEIVAPPCYVPKSMKPLLN